MSEIISSDTFWWGIIVADVLWVTGLLALKWVRHWQACRIPTEERDLGQHLIREQLQEFLRRNNIVGAADIRDGWVFAPVDPDRLDPLVRTLMSAYLTIAGQSENSRNGMIYGHAHGRYIPLCDVEDLREAHTALSRVVEDRRKSRALYKGFSENEIDMMVRDGLSASYKDDGEFADSNMAASGLLDKSRDFLLAKQVLELALEIITRSRTE
jgi:hypothetical protein